MREPVVSKVFTIANILTFLRMGLIPFFAILLVYHRDAWALVVFTVAGITDGIDGFIARRMKQESELGTILDPIADKLLMTTAFVMLTFTSILSGQHLPVPFWVTATVIGRDVMIVVVAGAINMMTGFRGFKPSWLGKASTFVQVLGVMLILIASVLQTNNGYYLPTTYAVIAAFALFSGIHYIYHVAKLMRASDAEARDAEAPTK